MATGPGVSEKPGGRLGKLLAPLGQVLNPLDWLLGSLEALLGPPGALLEASWGHLGGILGANNLSTCDL